MKEGRVADDCRDVMTIPRQYWLGPDGSLRMAPVAEIEGIRGDETKIGPAEIPANVEVALETVRGKAIEIRAIIESGSSKEVGLSVLRSPDGVEQTRISLLRGKPGTSDGEEGTMSRIQIDVSRASLHEDVYAREPEVGPLDLDPDEPVHLRVFVDRSIIEVFVADQQCLTLRTYPSRADSAGVALFARGGVARLQSLSALQMCSIWPELRHFERH